MLELLGAPATVAFVADAGGEVVGELLVVRRVAEVASIGMSVSKEWRRRGIGTALLCAGVEWAREHALRQLELRVLSTNEPALGLYEKFGFVEERTEHGARGDAIVMILRLRRSGEPPVADAPATSS